MSRNEDTIELLAKLVRRVLSDPHDLEDLVALLKRPATRPQTAGPRRNYEQQESRAPRGGRGGRPVSTGIPAEDMKRDGEMRGRGRGGDGTRGGRGGEQRRENVRAIPRSQAFGAPERRTEGFNRPATAPSSEQPQQQTDRSNTRRRNNRRPKTDAN
mmetsp:Transcript_68602/g.79940  ORF Transcript_68602/g.79940 Transcript_68602/m.79940 type:complete len:157 (+) Transcript_68602:46-516(+)